MTITNDFLNSFRRNILMQSWEKEILNAEKLHASTPWRMEDKKV